MSNSMLGNTALDGGAARHLAGNLAYSFPTAFTMTEERPAAAAVEVRSGNGIAALLALEPAWTALAALRPSGGFHHHFAWQMSYLLNLEEDVASVHFFSFFRHSKVIAIVPLRRVRRAVAGIPLWLWEFPFDPHVNLCDCLIAPNEDGVAVLRLLINTLDTPGAQAWDVLHFPNLLENALILNALRATPQARIRIVKTGCSMAFDCHDFDAVMDKITTKFKRNLRRQYRKLEQLGQVEVELVQERYALNDALTRFLHVEASGWKGDGDGASGSAIILHPHRVRFYRELIERFSASRGALISLLKLDGKVIAGQFCLLAGTTLHILKIGYDEEFSAEAPGQQLLQAVIKHCCVSSSITHLSLVTGPAWAAERWSPDTVDVWDACVFNGSPRGMAAYAGAQLRSGIAGLLRRPS